MSVHRGDFDLPDGINLVWPDGRPKNEVELVLCGLVARIEALEEEVARLRGEDEEDNAAIEESRQNPGPLMAWDEYLAQRGRHYDIIVNAREMTVAGPMLSYLALVELAHPEANASTIYTITYRRGPDENREGSLLPSEAVYLKEGMIFNVIFTGYA